RIAPGSADDDAAVRARPVVFEPMHDATLYDDHNRIDLYAWGDRRCCLPRGATRLTLAGHRPHLAPGDALLLEEVLGPLTGVDRDADPDHRQVVRLTAVHAFSPDDATKPREDPLTHDLITEIEWFSEDALRFPLCLSSVTDADHGRQYVDHVSV